MVREVAHEIDKTSFVMVTETNEVFGEGFLERSSRKIEKRRGERIDIGRIERLIFWDGVCYNR